MSDRLDNWLENIVFYIPDPENPRSVIPFDPSAYTPAPLTEGESASPEHLAYALYQTLSIIVELEKNSSVDLETVFEVSPDKPAFLEDGTYQGILDAALSTLEREDAGKLNIILISTVGIGDSPILTSYDPISILDGGLNIFIDPYRIDEAFLLRNDAHLDGLQAEDYFRNSLVAAFMDEIFHIADYNSATYTRDEPSSWNRNVNSILAANAYANFFGYPMRETDFSNREGSGIILTNDLFEATGLDASSLTTLNLASLSIDPQTFTPTDYNSFQPADTPTTEETQLIEEQLRGNAQKER